MQKDIIVFMLLINFEPTVPNLLFHFKKSTLCYDYAEKHLAFVLFQKYSNGNNSLMSAAFGESYYFAVSRLIMIHCNIGISTVVNDHRKKCAHIFATLTNDGYVEIFRDVAAWYTERDKCLATLFNHKDYDGSTPTQIKSITI